MKLYERAALLAAVIVFCVGTVAQCARAENYTRNTVMCDPGIDEAPPNAIAASALLNLWVNGVREYESCGLLFAGEPYTVHAGVPDGYVLYELIEVRGKFLVVFKNQSIEPLFNYL